MTTLDLNAFGVTEMSHAEKVEENGGIAHIVYAVGKALVAAAVYVFDNWDDISAGASAGYDAADNAYKG